MTRGRQYYFFYDTVLLEDFDGLVWLMVLNATFNNISGRKRCFVVFLDYFSEDDECYAFQDEDFNFEQLLFYSRD
jgi:hypothetical protein